MIKLKSLSCRRNFQNNNIDFYCVLENVENLITVIPNKNTQIYKSKNNTLEFIQKCVFFFSPPIITQKKFICSNSRYIFFSKVESIINNNTVILSNNFKIFVNYFCFNVTKNIKLILPFGLIGRILISKRVSWIIKRVVWFSKFYFGLNKEIKLNVYIFNFCKENSLEPIITTTTSNFHEIFLNINYIPFPEKRFKGFKTNLRVLFKKFLLIVFLQNGFLFNELLNGFINLLCFYVELINFKNQNELLYKIFKDYKNNRKKSAYFFFRILNNIVRNDENILSLHYLKLLKNFIQVKPFNLENICKKFNVSESLFTQDYPILKINIEEVPQNHIFYLKISVSNNNSSLSLLECKLYERICQEKKYLNVPKNKK